MGPDDCFGHGYLLSTTKISPPATNGWRTLAIGKATYRFQQRTAYAHHSRPVTEERQGVPRRDVVMIGHPVDLDRDTSDSNEIAAHVGSLVNSGGLDLAVRYVAYLGGRFTCFIHDGTTVDVIPDCHASQSVYWRSSPAGFTASSHVELVAAAANAQLDEHALGLYNKLVEIRKGVGTKYFPGIVTTHRHIRPVMPNCLLRVDIDTGRSEHRRFYPFGDLVRHDDVDRAYTQFEELFRTHARLLSGLGRVGVSVTSGLDSRVTLAASRAFLRPDSFAFTFYRAVSPSEAHTEDMYEGNRLAWEYGLPHRVVRWGGRDRADSFDEIFSTTFPRLGQARTLAQAFYGQLPRDFFQFQSTIAETGTGFYRRRDVEKISGRRLAHLWHGAQVAAVPEFVDSFEDFIEFTDFRQETLHNLDYHDAFYWEHRNSRWAANRYHEADLAHRVVLPFNQRGLIEAMLSVPFEDRLAKVLLYRLVERYPPASG